MMDTRIKIDEDFTLNVYEETEEKYSIPQLDNAKDMPSKNFSVQKRTHYEGDRNAMLPTPKRKCPTEANQKENNSNIKLSSLLDKLITETDERELVKTRDILQNALNHGSDKPKIKVISIERLQEPPANVKERKQFHSIKKMYHVGKKSRIKPALEAYTVQNQGKQKNITVSSASNLDEYKKFLEKTYVPPILSKTVDILSSDSSTSSSDDETSNSNLVEQKKTSPNTSVAKSKENHPNTSPSNGLQVPTSTSNKCANAGEGNSMKTSTTASKKSSVLTPTNENHLKTSTSKTVENPINKCSLNRPEVQTSNFVGKTRHNIASSKAQERLHVSNEQNRLKTSTAPSKSTSATIAFKRPKGTSKTIAEILIEKRKSSPNAQKLTSPASLSTCSSCHNIAHVPSNLLECRQNYDLNRTGTTRTYQNSSKKTDPTSTSSPTTSTSSQNMANGSNKNSSKLTSNKCTNTSVEQNTNFPVLQPKKMNVSSISPSSTTSKSSNNLANVPSTNLEVRPIHVLSKTFANSMTRTTSKSTSNKCTNTSSKIIRVTKTTSTENTNNSVEATSSLTTSTTASKSNNHFKEPNIGTFGCLPYRKTCYTTKMPIRLPEYRDNLSVTKCDKGRKTYDGPARKNTSKTSTESTSKSAEWKEAASKTNTTSNLSNSTTRSIKDMFPPVSITISQTSTTSEGKKHTSDIPNAITSNISTVETSVTSKAGNTGICISNNNNVPLFKSMDEFLLSGTASTSTSKSVNVMKKPDKFEEIIVIEDTVMSPLLDTNKNVSSTAKSVTSNTSLDLNKANNITSEINASTSQSNECCTTTSICVSGNKILTGKTAMQNEDIIIIEAAEPNKNVSSDQTFIKIDPDGSFVSQIEENTPPKIAKNPRKDEQLMKGKKARGVAKNRKGEKNASLKNISETYKTVNEFIHGMINPDVEASSLPALLGKNFAKNFGPTLNFRK